MGDWASHRKGSWNVKMEGHGAKGVLMGAGAAKRQRVSMRAWLFPHTFDREAGAHLDQLVGRKHQRLSSSRHTTQRNYLDTLAAENKPPQCKSRSGAHPAGRAFAAGSEVHSTSRPFFGIRL